MEISMNMIQGFEKAEDWGEVIDDEDVLRSQPYTQIFDTEYYWDVPYLVDVEKYKKTFHTRMTDGYINSLSLTSRIENGYQVVWAWSSKKEENERDWTSDCFQFNYDNLDDFKEFVRKITTTFIGVDSIGVLEKCAKLEKEINNITEQKQRLLNVTNNK